MSTDDLDWSDSVEPAAWLEPRLSAFGSGVVSSVVPTGFPAYARLPHPVTLGPMGERTVRWAEVAAWSGQPLDRLAQFHDIAMPEHAPATTPPWDSQGPTTGTLCGADAAVLVKVLGEHTRVVDGVRRCWFCLWTGYGWEHAVYLLPLDAPAQLRAHPPRPPDPIPARVRQGGRVQLPYRDYFLFTGPVQAATAFVPEHSQTPNLWWSHDRSWCVASEIDLPWTYVGGSHDLIQQVLTHPDLEALPALPEDLNTLRAPAWLDAALRSAVDELLRDGETTVQTSVGTVCASLRVPTRLRAGLLRIDCHRRLSGGANGGRSETRLSPGDADRLRETIYSYLLRSTVSMVDN